MLFHNAIKRYVRESGCGKMLDMDYNMFQLGAKDSYVISVFSHFMPTIPTIDNIIKNYIVESLHHGSYVTVRVKEDKVEQIRFDWFVEHTGKTAFFGIDKKEVYYCNDIIAVDGTLVDVKKSWYIAENKWSTNKELIDERQKHFFGVLQKIKENKKKQLTGGETN